MKKRIIHILLLLATGLGAWADDTVSLQGTWRFQLDANNKGMIERWYDRELGDSIPLPCTTEKKQRMTLLIRQPAWLSAKMQVTVNGKPVATEADAQGYVAVNRRWRNGDRVELTLSMELRSEQLPDGRAYYAFLYGPIVLAANNGTDDLTGLFADDGRKAHEARGRMVPLKNAPLIVCSADSVARCCTVVSDSLLTFRLGHLFANSSDSVSGSFPAGASLTLQPFYTLHDSRYTIYFPQTTPDQALALRQRLDEAEAERLRLVAQTVDDVQAGQQQPEVDHAVMFTDSKTGTADDDTWRDAAGEFSYELQDTSHESRTLYLSFYHAKGATAYDIFVGDSLLQTVTREKGRGGRHTLTIDLPSAVLSECLRIRFVAHKGFRTDRIVEVRLLKTL